MEASWLRFLALGFGSGIVYKAGEASTSLSAPQILSRTGFRLAYPLRGLDSSLAGLRRMRRERRGNAWGTESDVDGNEDEDGGEGLERESNIDEDDVE